jgi:hypothetical protein
MQNKNPYLRFLAHRARQAADPKVTIASTAGSKPPTIVIPPPADDVVHTTGYVAFEPVDEVEAETKEDKVEDPNDF